MIDSQRYPRLARIDSPADLRKFDESELPEVARELREYLIESVAGAGGHFGAGLGVVELTVALHYLYDTPDDRLVWDVGHQCYPHKILTGRRDRIGTIKKKDGLAPFPAPRRKRIRHVRCRPFVDVDLGRARHGASPRSAKAIARKIVAIIGDGGLTGGMAYEALHHGGDVDPDLLVILNDNQMSISENVGALPKMLARLMTSRRLNAMREGAKRRLKRDGFLWRFLKRWEEHLKGMFVPSTLFEEFNFHYFGPIDGHDLPMLLHSLKTLKELKGPQLLHIITTKGKGYAPAEREQIEYHAVGPFDPVKGVAKKAAGKHDLHRSVRRLAVRHGRGRCAPVRHHAGDARRLRPGALLEGISTTILRCRHRRTARRHAGRRHGLRRRKTRRRDLFHLSAARLRSADPRRRDPEPRRHVRASTAAASSAPTARRMPAVSI